MARTSTTTPPSQSQKLCWKNATVRPPLLLVGILAGWAWVVFEAPGREARRSSTCSAVRSSACTSTLHAALILFCVLLAFHLVHFVASEIPGLTWRPWLMSNVCVHLVFLLLAALPCSNVFFGPSRISLIRTVLESAIAPFTQVTFWHVIVADYLTSAAKAFSDLQLTTCVSARIFAVHETAEYVRSTDLWHESYHVCSASGWNAVMLALPFWWRLMQCLKVYSITGESKNLWNALKYSTAFPLVYAGYLKKNYPSALNDRLFVFAAVIQSTYCFIWDVHMDWGLFRLANVDGRSPAERGTSCCGGRPTICRLRRPLLITRSNGVTTQLRSATWRFVSSGRYPFSAASSAVAPACYSSRLSRSSAGRSGPSSGSNGRWSQKWFTRSTTPATHS